MIVVWGSKIVRKQLGLVAEYCIFCHEPRAFKLTTLTKKPHLMYLGLGSGTLVGHSVQCSTCGTSSQGDAEYKSVADRASAPDLKRLIQETNPVLPQRIETERELVRRIRAGQSSAEEKQDAIERPLRILNPDIETIREVRIDKEVGLVALGTIAVVVLCNVLFSKLGLSTRNVPPTLFLVGATLTIVLLVTSSRRFITRSIYPRLRGALAPLRPTESELTTSLKHLDAMGYFIGTKLNPTKLSRAIRGS